MAQGMLVCGGCGATLRTNDPSPAGKLIRCPVCEIVFKVPVEKPSGHVQALRENELNCADCGATLQSDLPLLPGQFVQCPECTTIFRVPDTGSPSVKMGGKQEADRSRSPSSTIIQLRPSVFALKEEPLIEAEQVRPWDALPDEIRIEFRNEERAKRLSKRKRIAILVAAILTLACGLGSITLFIVFWQPERTSSPAAGNSTTPNQTAQTNPGPAITPPVRKESRVSRIESDDEEGLVESKSPGSKAERAPVQRHARRLGNEGFQETSGGSSSPAIGGEKIQLISMTGFVVTTGGHILTSAQVARDPAAVLVRIPNSEDLPAAQVVAVDEARDLALLRIKIPQGISLTPLPLDPQRELRRGESVTLLDYPSQDTRGAQLKGVIAQFGGPSQDQDSDLFQFESPRSSCRAGTPVCDTSGNVIAMVVTARGSRRTPEGEETALRARDLHRFLQDRIEGYGPIASFSGKKEWDEIEKAARASVVLVMGHK
jgi:S1-C subfamily serine protease/DNA-directed RNA polymerase subunit RPC12/RpoP